MTVLTARSEPGRTQPHSHCAPALPGQSPRVTGGDHVPDDLMQHRLPQSQPPTLSTETLTASTRQVPQGPSFLCVFLRFYHSVKNNPLSL